VDLSVLSRCAIMSVVRPTISFSRLAMMPLSVSTSTALVGSSNHKVQIAIDGFFYGQRNRTARCFNTLGNRTAHRNQI
jgi:hypothetical protein